MDGIDESADSEEARFLRSELERIEFEHTELVLQRAEAANTEVQIRLLLELVDAMNGSSSSGSSTEPHTGDGTVGPCYDYEEFFRLTSYVLDEGIVGDDGRILAFSNDMVIRYLDTETILDYGY